MRRTWSISPRSTRFRYFSSSVVHGARPPIVQITNGTFYRRQPSQNPTDEEALANKPLFPNLNFTFPTDNPDGQYWAIVGPSNAGKTTFLDILRGQHLCFPPNARTYPYLSTDEIAAKDIRLRYPGHAVQYVGFSDKDRGLSGLGTYMSARYESRREVTDFSLLNYLRGDTQLNADGPPSVDEDLLARILNDLRLSSLIEMPVSNLSNGQTRRARIAKAFLGKPELLLLDEPFMGLDPVSSLSLSALLETTAKSNNPRLLISLRPQDAIPTWINNVLFLGANLQVTHQGPVGKIAQELQDQAKKFRETPVQDTPTSLPTFYAEFGRKLDKSIYESSTKFVVRRDADEIQQDKEMVPGEPVIEMDGVKVRYGERTVLGGDKGLFWTVRRGERWGVFGPNGSGKTTLLSLITSDHPQAYSAPMKLFGRSRLPQRGVRGISVFELQSRIGHSSPEVHAFFPRSLSVRATLESAYADTPLAHPTGLTVEADRRIDACLRWFQGELNPAVGMNPDLQNEVLSRRRRGRLDYVQEMPGEAYKEVRNEWWYTHDQEQSESINWADKMIFGELSFSAQRVALFLRAIVKAPDLVILDEAFSGMDDYVRDKCLLFLSAGETKELSPYSRADRNYSPSGFIPARRTIRELRDCAITEGLSKEQALVCISHIKEEVPREVKKWIYLPEADTGQRVRKGRLPLHKTVAGTDGVWRVIWGLERKLARDTADAGSTEEQSSSI